MRPFKPTFWPAPVFVRDHDGEGNLRPTKRGKRAASNRGLWIVISKNAMERKPWILEQEKYESRYWVTHFWHTVWVWGYWLLPPIFTDDYAGHPMYKKAAAHLASVECQSRAQEIRARNHKTHEDWGGLARDYAHSIHNAPNYPYIKAAGWGEERVYQEIIKWL